MASSDLPIPSLLRLAASDNVAVATGTLTAGQSIRCDGEAIVVRDPAPVGHKVAVRDIRQGEKIIKFGCPIGSATRDIAAGQHVHTHNLKSDYLPTFTFDEGKRFLDASEPPEPPERRP